MNKFTKILTALIINIVLLLSTPASIWAATLSLNPAVGTFNKGCSYSVQILLDTTGSNVGGVDAILTYDPAKMRTAYEKIQNGTIFPEYINSVDAATKEINIGGLASPTQSFNGQGILATINFDIPAEAAKGTSTLVFKFDSNNRSKTDDTNVVEVETVTDVLTSVTNGTYTIADSTGNCSTTGGRTGTGSGTGALGKGGLEASGSTGYEEPIYKTLPTSGLFDQTLILATIGTLLVLFGIGGLTLVKK